MIEGGIADEVRRKSIKGLQNDARTENKGIEEEATAATRQAKEKRSTRICLKGRRKKKKKLKAMRLKIDSLAIIFIVPEEQNTHLISFYFKSPLD